MVADAKAAVQRYIDAVNAHDVDAYDRVLTPGFIYHGAPSLDGRRLELEAHKQFAAEMFDGFPDTRITVEHTSVDGEMVCMRYVWTGTNTGPLMGAEPTGASISVDGLWHLRVEGDRVAEEWEQIDTLGVMQQLGLVPGNG